MNVTRRRLFGVTLAAVLAGAGGSQRPAAIAAEELKLADTVPTEKFDFKS